MVQNKVKQMSGDNKWMQGYGLFVCGCGECVCMLDVRLYRVKLLGWEERTS